MITTRNLVTLEYLRRVKLPAARHNGGGVWKGVQHGLLVDTIIEQMSKHGCLVSEVKVELSRGDADMAAGFLLGTAEGRAACLGLTASNAKRLNLTFYVGFNCPPAIVFSSFAGARYTRQFNVEDECRKAVEEWFTRAKTIPAQLNRLAEINISSDLSEHLLFIAGNRRHIPFSRIGRVQAEFLKSRKSALHLLIAFSKIAQTNPPITQMNQIMRFHNLLLTAKEQNAATNYS